MPDDILSWMDSFGTRKKQKINQCELLAVIAAVMTFGDIFRDRELLVWVDNVPALSAAVHGYSHAPEMASLSNALHLLLAGLSAIPRFLHVPSPKSLGRRTPLTFLVACPSCVAMGPMSWTQLDSAPLMRVL